MNNKRDNPAKVDIFIRINKPPLKENTSKQLDSTHLKGWTQLAKPETKPVLEKSDGCKIPHFFPACSKIAILEPNSAVAESGATYPMDNKEKQRVKDGEEKDQECENTQEPEHQDPDILEEIEIEEFAVDGICGVY